MPDIPRELPREDMQPEEAFFTGTRIDTRVPSEIGAAFVDGGFPYMCHVQYDAMDTGSPGRSSSHTFIVLGRDGDNLVIWEKVARRKPHRRSTLQDLLKIYDPKIYNFYMRPMKRAVSDTERP